MAGLAAPWLPAMAAAAAAAAAVPSPISLSGGTPATQLPTSESSTLGITKKAPTADPLPFVGAVVLTKALTATSYMEVSRLRGALAKDIFMDGYVLKVVR